MSDLSLQPARLAKDSPPERKEAGLDGLLGRAILPDSDEARIASRKRISGEELKFILKEHQLPISTDGLARQFTREEGITVLRESARCLSERTEELAERINGSTVKLLALHQRAIKELESIGIVSALIHVTKAARTIVPSSVTTLFAQADKQKTESGMNFLIGMIKEDLQKAAKSAVEFGTLFAKCFPRDFVQFVAHPREKFGKFLDRVKAGFNGFTDPIEIEHKPTYIRGGISITVKDDGRWKARERVFTSASRIAQRPLADVRDRVGAIATNIEEELEVLAKTLQAVSELPKELQKHFEKIPSIVLYTSEGVTRFARGAGRCLQALERIDEREKADKSAIKNFIRDTANYIGAYEQLIEGATAEALPIGVRQRATLRYALKNLGDKSRSPEPLQEGPLESNVIVVDTAAIEREFRAQMTSAFDKAWEERAEDTLLTPNHKTVLSAVRTFLEIQGNAPEDSKISKENALVLSKVRNALDKIPSNDREKILDELTLESYLALDDRVAADHFVIGVQQLKRGLVRLVRDAFRPHISVRKERSRLMPRVPTEMPLSEVEERASALFGFAEDLAEIDGHPPGVVEQFLIRHPFLFRANDDQLKRVSATLYDEMQLHQEATVLVGGNGKAKKKLHLPVILEERFENVEELLTGFRASRRAYEEIIRECSPKDSTSGLAEGVSEVDEPPLVAKLPSRKIQLDGVSRERAVALYDEFQEIVAELDADPAIGRYGSRTVLLNMAAFFKPANPWIGEHYFRIEYVSRNATALAGEDVPKDVQLLKFLYNNDVLSKFFYKGGQNVISFNPHLDEIGNPALRHAASFIFKMKDSEDKRIISAFLHTDWTGLQ